MIVFHYDNNAILTTNNCHLVPGESRDFMF